MVFVCASFEETYLTATSMLFCWRSEEDDFAFEVVPSNYFGCRKACSERGCRNEVVATGMADVGERI